MKITCEDLVRHLSDYLDNELDEELSQDVQEHLSTCENCRVVLNSTEKTILLYREHGQFVRIPSGRKRALFNQIAHAFGQKGSSQPE